MSEKISDERLRNTRAWAAARVGQMSGAEVIVAAIDEVFHLRELLKRPDNYEETEASRTEVELGSSHSGEVKS